MKKDTMQVLKFGGSSVANATNMSRVLDIVGKACAKGRVILVCSAIGGCTDFLIDISGTPAGSADRRKRTEPLLGRHLEIIRRLFTGKEREEAADECRSLCEELINAKPEEVVTYGEVFSTKIMARKLICDGVKAKWIDSRLLVIKGDKELTYSNIASAIATSPDVDVFVAPGFIANDGKGNAVTLGRGGSDLSAAIYAAAIQADRLEIWTDVPGMMTANPKDVPAASTIPRMSYAAALDMASHGAKVLYAPTVQPAMEAGIAINILSTFEPDNPGTVVADMQGAAPQRWVGVASTGDKDAHEAVICLVGEGGFNAEAACARVRSCLIKAGIEPVSLTAEEGHVLIRVREAVEKPALRSLHKEFFDTVPLRTLNLFIAGYGAVGKALVELIAQSAGSVAHSTGKTIRIAGLCNNRRWTVDMQGIPPQLAAERLAHGQPMDGNAFIEEVKRQAPRHSIFVECTDSEDIHKEFPDILAAGLDIVTSNRRSMAVPYVEYAAMKSAARENGVFLRYDTTVGAALPMLGSIAMSKNSSNEILSIEAVVSCTMNQILTSYDYSPATFAEIVRRAQDDGLTERDPRIDLSGRDAVRKLLILGREAGIPLEVSDIEVTPVVGFDAPLEELYGKLEAMEPQFAAAEDAADAANSHQRFVASLWKDETAPLGYRATIRIRLVDQRHPAYWITGTENAIIIRSAYHPYPLVIEGPGEGAREAASSVLNDILR